MTHRRDVLVTSTAKGGVTVVPNTKIDKVARKDTVQWTFENTCGKTLTFSIGNFRPAVGFSHLKECRDKNPFDKKSSLRVRLAHRGKGLVGGQIRADAHFPRTYKYDIFGGRAVLLDPEIEIER